MNENEIIMENLDTVENIMEQVPEKNGVNFGAIGLGVLVVGAIAALGYKGYKLIKAKKATKGSQEAENVDVFDAEDFADEESAE